MDGKQLDLRRESAPPSWSRIAATFVGTVLVLLVEFLVLSGVYHRSDAVDEQRIIVASLAGQVVSSPGAAVLADTENALAGLGRAGLAQSNVSGIEQAATALEADPSSVAARTELRVAVDRLASSLQARQDSYDQQAELTYAVLLVLASIGWFVWFQRLVKRHRRLQRKLTHQQALAASEQRLLALVQNGSDLVAVLDADSTSTFVSPSAASVLGASSAELTGERLVDLVHPDDVPRFVQLLATQRGGDDDLVQLRMRHGDGRSIVVEGVVSNLLADPNVGGFVLTVRDVTERQALHEELTRQAFRDSLTGLANRQLFKDRLEHALVPRRDGRAPEPLAVLFCDIDDFKHVNDSKGHGTGDRVLAQIAERISAAMGGGDTAARLGGDEFAVLMERAELVEAQSMAEQLLRAVGEPLVVDGMAITVQASIGIAVAEPGASTAEDVVRNADVAMYWAKDSGKSTVAVYEASLHAADLDRLELRSDLQRAIRDDELVVHYQPTIVLQTGEISGFEALVRWQHPTRGLLPPAEFIPLAEETGLIACIGQMVLREACLAALSMQGVPRPPTMSVNVAAQQLAQPGFADDVLAVLVDTGLAPDRLVLEVTESVVLSELESVAPRLAALRDRGIRIAIDDFGTGYSSLAYLTSLPIDILKVDKSFVDRVTTDAQAASITEAILSMSRAMQLSTVAEGVEDPEQADWLRRAHCRVGQGFLWSRPLELEAARALLNDPATAGAAPVVAARRGDTGYEAPAMVPA